ncbi:MAG TPA: hypothetical protein VGL77_20450 [Armatimonadota bacterium]|jgi:hypothetical protein
MHRVLTPEELIAEYGPATPEQLAAALGFAVRRVPATEPLPGVTVLSEFAPPRTIVLDTAAIHRQAAAQREPLARAEQWHIAHELYHGLAEESGRSAWRVRETEADLWADELLTLTPFA